MCCFQLLSLWLHLTQVQKIKRREVYLWEAGGLGSHVSWALAGFSQWEGLKRDGGTAGGVWQETRVSSQSSCHAWPLGWSLHCLSGSGCHQVTSQIRTVFAQPTSPPFFFFLMVEMSETALSKKEKRSRKI